MNANDLRKVLNEIIESLPNKRGDLIAKNIPPSTLSEFLGGKKSRVETLCKILTALDLDVVAYIQSGGKLKSVEEFQESGRIAKWRHLYALFKTIEWDDCRTSEEARIKALFDEKDEPLQDLAKDQHLWDLISPSPEELRKIRASGVFRKGPPQNKLDYAEIIFHRRIDPRLFEGEGESKGKKIRPQRETK